MSDLIVVETLKAEEVFAPEKPSIKALISDVTERAEKFKGDVSTESGRKEIASFAYKIARSKTALDGLGKDYVAKIKAETKIIDDLRKEMRDTFDALKNKVRAPLDEYEEAERRREEAIKETIRDLTNLSQATMTEIDRLEDGLRVAKETVIGEEFGALKDMALDAKEKAVAYLTNRIAEMKQAEADRAELEALRAEREAREAEDRRKAAELAAKERVEQIRKEEAEKARAMAQQAAAAERERIENELRRERERMEAEALKIEQEEERRAANKSHRTKVNRTALADLMKAGLSEDDGKLVIESVAKGQISNITIQY